MTAIAPPPTPRMILDTMQDIVRTVDEHAREMNRRWGFNRLPHLVPLEWTERFVSQKRKWEMAVFECVGDPRPEPYEQMRKHGDAMIRAYDKLDELALVAGKSPAAPGTWEFELPDGTPIALVRTRAEIGQVEREPKVQVWCLEEIGQIIAKFPELVLATKSAFPHAEVIQLSTGADVHDALNDSLEDLPGFEPRSITTPTTGHHRHG
ncbi:hypothetical protein [Qipengyuania sp. MTN3-11]|uniref:hypothetical protein n=1 Tax=Qipengyuania sp. MTN3-11 TaxID=3056557 RepID=UPI0036F23137